MCIRDSKYAKAVEAYSRALEVSPNNAILLSNRAFAHVRLENYGSAIEDASKAIESDRNAYYDALKSAQRTNETTDWIRYFLSVCLQAQQDAEEQIDFTLQKVKFFDIFKDKLNKRQTRVIRRMLDEGPKGFEGGMSANKYVSIAKTSKPSATRDLQALAEMKALIVTGGGRSTRYWLPFDVRAKAQERSQKRTAPKAGSKQKT